MNKNKELFDLHHSHWNSSEEIDKKDFEQHIKKHEKLDKLLPHSPFFYAVINLHTYEYEFLGRGQFLLTGFSNELVQKQGIRFQMEHIHPEDGEILLKVAYAKFHEIIVSTEPSEVSRLVMQCNYRIRHIDGHYVHLLEQVWPVKTDEEGKPLLCIMHVNELPELTPFRMKVSIRKLLPNHTYDKLYCTSFPEAEEDLLTEREKAIVKLIADGHSSKSIATEMSLSYHTVRTHRKNILRKLGLNSTSELIGYAFVNHLA